jgi:hypothetical protein
MIQAGCFEKLLEVIGGLPYLALRITFGGGDELLVGAVSVLVIIIITLIAASGDRDSLWSPF